MDTISRTIAREVLRKSIGLVLQEPFLYHGTIASNIRMYHEELTEAEIQQAAEFVDVAEFIESLPGGYNHPVTRRVLPYRLVSDSFWLYSNHCCST